MNFASPHIRKLNGGCASVLSGVTDLFSINKIKYHRELNYWKKKHKEEQYKFQNSFYQKLMLKMADEPNDSFLLGKTIVDFGCGPRGSLVWTNSPALKIGVDVLADKYFDAFSDDMIADGYPYVKCTEKFIPLPSNFADVVFTMNAMDHTTHFEKMLEEIFRILKTDGLFIGSFNLNETPTLTEPQKLTYEKLQKVLFPKIEILHQKLAFNGNDLIPKRSTYFAFYENDIQIPSHKDKCIMWIKGIKK